MAGLGSRRLGVEPGAGLAGRKLAFGSSDEGSTASSAVKKGGGGKKKKGGKRHHPSAEPSADSLGGDSACFQLFE